jgi:hypothetical protein
LLNSKSEKFIKIKKYYRFVYSLSLISTEALFLYIVGLGDRKAYNISTINLNKIAQRLKSNKGQEFIINNTVRSATYKYFPSLSKSESLLGDLWECSNLLV